ncbi:MAG: Gfo/Idh/MocA family protein [Thermoguttaceae bacterium]
MNRRTNRRRFLAKSAVAGVGLWLAAPGTPAQSRSPNQKLNIGVIGAGGRGAANTGGVASENIVALCDTNAKHLEAAAARFPKAARFRDWRNLLDQKGIDAVVISTPDHTHAPASVAAMKRGMHVYCEKPLAHSVYEARVVQETCKKANVATQMGTQIHAGDNYRRVVELVQSGAIGPVREVYVWCDRKGFPPGTTRPKDEPPVPEHLDWDLWLGPAPYRPYHPSYLGGCTVWEQWWDFGNGCLGDMGSHLIDLPFWALKLRQPKTIEAEGANRSEEVYPQWLIVRWEHPETPDHPALSLTWSDGGKKPPSPKEPARNLGSSPRGKAKEEKDQPVQLDLAQWGIGVMFVGSEGTIVADYGKRFILPFEKFKDFQPPEPSILPSRGHYAEWLHGCKTGEPTLCNFQYSGMLIEHNLLGTVAWRVGQKLTWDPAAMKAPGCPEADQYIRRQYRAGWEL